MEINNVVIDTGSSHTVINPDYFVWRLVSPTRTETQFMRPMGLVVTVHFYAKTMDSIEIGDFKLGNVEIDVSILPNDHSGLLGLDILLKSGFILDLNTLELSLIKS